MVQTPKIAAREQKSNSLHESDDVIHSKRQQEGLGIAGSLCEV
jgi:hypothetical protein